MNFPATWKHIALLLIELIIIARIFCESEAEVEERELLCGRKPDGFMGWKKYPWFVALRWQSSIWEHEHMYDSGTLVSNRYVLTVSDMFRQGWTIPAEWAALPGAYDIADIKNYKNEFKYGSDWRDIESIEVHPLYDREHKDFK